MAPVGRELRAGMPAPEGARLARAIAPRLGCSHRWVRPALGNPTVCHCHRGPCQWRRDGLSLGAAARAFGLGPEARWQATAASQWEPARDFGRGASPLVYAAQISRSLAAILREPTCGNLTHGRRKIEPAPPGRKTPEDSCWRACGEGLVNRRLPHARGANYRDLHPGLKTVRHALCCVASQSIAAG